MVVDRLRAQRADDPVKRLRRSPLEEAVGPAVIPDPVNDLRATSVRLNHFRDDLNVILEIGVHAQQNIPVAGIQARQQGILMPAIARQLDAADARVRARKPFDHLPGAVTAAVVDEHHLAAGRHAAVGHHRLQQHGQTMHRLRQHLLLVETRDHDSESWNDVHIAACHGYTLAASLVRDPRRGRTALAPLFRCNSASLPGPGYDWEDYTSTPESRSATAHRIRPYKLTEVP